MKKYPINNDYVRWSLQSRKGISTKKGYAFLCILDLMQKLLDKFSFSFTFTQKREEERV
jgi:hypothetical protein